MMLPVNRFVERNDRTAYNYSHLNTLAIGGGDCIGIRCSSERNSGYE